MSVPAVTVAGMYHPWRTLRALDTRIEVIWQHLDDDVLAETDGHSTIWMDPRQRQAKRRCTLAHELAHIELGHTDGCTPREDVAADRLAARRLIDMHRLLDALRWAEDLREVADELWVDEPTLMARLDALTDDERAQIVQLYEEIEGGC